LIVFDIFLASNLDISEIFISIFFENLKGGKMSGKKSGGRALFVFLVLRT